MHSSVIELTKAERNALDLGISAFDNVIRRQGIRIKNGPRFRDAESKLALVIIEARAFHESLHKD